MLAKRLSNRGAEASEAGDENPFITHDFTHSGSLGGDIDIHSGNKAKRSTSPGSFDTDSCYFILKVVFFVVFMLFPFVGIITLFSLIGVAKPVINNVSIELIISYPFIHIFKIKT
jgi:hypothetical protein